VLTAAHGRLLDSLADLFAAMRAPHLLEFTTWRPALARLLPGKIGKKWGNSGVIGKYPMRVPNY
jgi:hypothetical protein